jgi:cell division protein FtsQ
MTTDFSYAASENIEARSSKKIEKGLKRLLVIAVIILAAELIWLFGISPFIPFSTVEVHGFDGLSRAEILALAGIDETSSYMSSDEKQAQERLCANILVESAKVIKRFPDKISIFLTPRRAAAVILAPDGLGQTLLYVDKQGVFFKEGQAGEEIPGLPVISGLENPVLYARLSSPLVSLVESISVIESLSPELLAAVSEIRVEQKAWDGCELVIFPVHSAIRVRVENNLSEDILRYMLLMLNVFENDSQRPQEIDFRSGMGAYKIKEQS